MTYSLILFLRTRHRTKKSSSLLSKPSSTWTCWPDTFRRPSTKSARLLRRMYCYNQLGNSSSLSGRTSDFSASTPNGHSSKGYNDAESPSRSNKDILCSGNVWLFQPRCGLKFSNSFIKDTRGSNEWNHSRANTHTGRAWPRHWRNGSALRALRSNRKVASQSNTALVAYSNRTLGGHSKKTLLVQILEGTSSSSWTPTQCTPMLFHCPARRPGRQWQYFINYAPNMVFQRRSSATTGRSLPRTISGSSVRVTLSITFCHHRTAPNEMDGPNSLSTPSSAASSNCDGREMWIKSWIHSC